MSKLLSISEVATMLGCSKEHVRRLDDELKPQRFGKINQRLYDSDVVERVRKERAKKAAKRLARAS